MALTKIEQAAFALADAIDALEALKVANDSALDPRRVSLAVTSAEESALWLKAASAPETIPQALRHR